VNTSIGVVGQWETAAAADSSWMLNRVSGSFGFRFVTSGGSTTAISSSWTPVANTWYHVAVDRDTSNVIRVYINGAILTSATNAGDIRNIATTPLRVGRTSSSLSTHDLNGYIDDVRITKGIARYGGSFTPHQVAFPDIAVPVVSTRRRPVIMLCG
jgi:hypothetical protein